MTYRAALVAVVMLWSPTARAERLPLKMFTTADGLPHNQIFRIVRDSRGFLWFCTRDGLSRFDGYQFTNFGVDEGLPQSTVNDLIEAHDGTLWIATSGGLVAFDPSGMPSAQITYVGRSASSRHPMFTVLSPNGPDPKARAVNRLMQDRHGTIWCATDAGLQRLDRKGNHPRLVDIDLGASEEQTERVIVWDLVEASDGTLWLATANGLFHRTSDGAVHRYGRSNGLPTNRTTQTDDEIRSVFVDHAGRLWATTFLAGFFGFRASEAEDRLVVNAHYTIGVDPDFAFPKEWIYELFERSDGTFWVATTSGIVEFVDEPTRAHARYHWYNLRHGLSYPEITAVNEDVAGNLWMGTKEAGVMKLSRNGFTTFAESDDVRAAASLVEDSRGDLCVRGTPTEYLLDQDPNFPTPFASFNGARFTWFAPATLARAPDVGWGVQRTLVRSRTGEWWIGAGVGVVRFPATAACADIGRVRPLARYGTDAGLANPQVYRLFEDSHQRMWVATYPYGLMRWDRATDTWWNAAHATGSPELERTLVRAFAEGRDGDIWIGYGDRPVRWRDGRFEMFGERDGVPPGEIADMDVDADGRLWLASVNGLIRVDAPEADVPRFTTYTTARGLSSNRTEVVVSDTYGRIYAGTSRGIDRLEPATRSIKHFTTVDGLAGGQFRVAYRDHAGALWFGTTGGLSRFVPVREEMIAEPRVFVTRLIIAGVPQAVSVRGETAVVVRDLQPTENSVDIEYVGLDFQTGESLRYQYKLERAGADWSVPVDRRILNFGNLAPGRYRFLVRAINSKSIPSATPAMVTFTILRPVWQRWWFVTISLGAVAAAAWSFHRYRVKRELELADVRAQIALDLHDDIGSNLTKISILSELARQRQRGDAAPDDLLAAIATIARESVAAMGDIVWAINPQRDRLLDLVQRMRFHAEEVCGSAGIALTFVPPAAEPTVKLSADVRRDVFLIFKEAVNNIARHSRCRVVTVRLDVEGPMISLELSDDGIGFDPSHVGEGHGLGSMQRRAAAHGGTIDTRSAPGRGTLIACRVPLAKSATLGQPT